MSQVLNSSISRGLPGFCGFHLLHPRHPRLDIFQELCHFLAALPPPHTRFIDDPESRRFGYHLLMCRKSYRVADFRRLDVGSSFVEDMAIEDHHTSEQRRVDGNKGVRSAGKQTQLLESDF